MGPGGEWRVFLPLIEELTLPVPEPWLHRTSRGTGLSQKIPCESLHPTFATDIALIFQRCSFRREIQEFCDAENVEDAADG